MSRNKVKICPLCKKSFRSDTLFRHSKACSKKANNSKDNSNKKQCKICFKTINFKNYARHILIHESKRTIVDDLKEGQKIFENKIKAGKVIKSVIRNKMANPKSLKQEYLEAIDTESDSGNILVPRLKIWQQKLLNKLIPSERDVIWVTGKIGGEGKSFFQRYLLEIIGHHKTFLSTVDKRCESILHALSKCQLSMIDVFIFNIPRCFEPENVPYSVFEDIKDGFCLSPKYNSKQLKFTTPNILVIFSNFMPFIHKMSHDRWNIFEILDDDLVFKS